jgi:anti-sigma regulatory factor (Ser/Thr protein kinase)
MSLLPDQKVEDRRGGSKRPARSFTATRHVHTKDIEPFQASFAQDFSLLSNLRRQFSAWLADVQVSDEIGYEILLATHEAAANAIEYARPATEVTVRGVRDDRKLIVVVTNSGAWKDPRSVDERGQGLILMDKLMSKVDVHVDLERTVVRMRKDLAAPPSARA